MRSDFVKDGYGQFKYERDDDWPYILDYFSPNERVIYAADGQRLILQQRHRREENGRWGKWVRVGKALSHEQMRKHLERYHIFASDSEKLDAICLKTHDGDYVEHSH